LNAGLHPVASRCAPWLRWAVIAMVAIFPLVLFPGLERPFSTPKIFLLEGFVVVAGICAVGLGLLSRPRLPRGVLFSLILWAVALACSAAFAEFVSREALVLPLFSMAWFLLVVALRPKAVYLAAAMSLACLAVAVIVLLQYSGLDPFRFLGWAGHQQVSPRMRVGGTLGNPNFAAALLVSGMPVAWALGKIRKWRSFPYIVMIVEASAVFATGSKAGVLAVSASLLWLGGLATPALRRWVAAGAVAVIAVALFMPSRPVLTTIEGRLYIWRVTAAHLLERPLTGFGPGAFEPKYVAWETRYWREGHGTDAERTFAQLQAHAHNDYLETMVDSGAIGVLGMVSLMLSFLVFAFRQARDAGNELVAGASAGVVALAAVALVDFPLRRPTELFCFWTLVAVACLAGPPSAALSEKQAVRG
jgi:hypothetical protein